MSTIDKTLEERGTRYGAFTGHAQITQGIKDAMKNSPNWSRLAPDQVEALEMTAHKIGRILNGDPNYIDSWHDIGGYIRLVEQRLEGEQPRTDAEPAVEASPEAPEEPCGCPKCRARRAIGAFLRGDVEGLTQIVNRSEPHKADLEAKVREALGPNVEIVWLG